MGYEVRHPTATVTGEQLAAAAQQYLGVPYRNGGHVPARGLDCVGLICQAYHDVGLSARDIMTDGVWPWIVSRLAAKWRYQWIASDETRPGDIIVYGSDGAYRHVAIVTDPLRQIAVSALVEGVRLHSIRAIRGQSPVGIIASGLPPALIDTMPVPPPAPSRTHRIARGDTLIGIARAYGLRTWRDLYLRNPWLLAYSTRALPVGRDLAI